ncbi:MAG: c-type cytochrome biogenesis protein CcmI, partial [Alphaproteobacteria bacterium]
MTQFLLFALVTVAALAMLIVPLLRPPARRVARAAYDLEVYRDQIAELDSDARRGLISESQRDAAKREIERRVLALDLGPAAWGDRTSTPMSRLIAAGAILMIVPLAAGAIYLGLGAPTLPDQPLAERAAEIAGGAEAGDIED